MSAFELTLILYFLASIGSVLLLFSNSGSKSKDWWIPTALAVVGWIFHSYALIGRYPGFGTFEALVFFSWALMTAQLGLEIRFSWPWTQFFSALFAFTSLGLALLVFAPVGPILIEPPPFLQSPWLLGFHSLTCMLAYGCLMMGSFYSIFFLLKDGLMIDTFQVFLSITGILVIAFSHGAMISPVIRGGAMLALGMQLLFAFGSFASDLRASRARARMEIAAHERRKRGLRLVELPAPGSAHESFLRIARVAFFFGWVFQVMLFYRVSSVASPFLFAALGILSVMGILALALLRLRVRVNAKLPSAESLDLWSFRSTEWGFVALTCSLVAGAFWSHDLHGTYWSWEPKTLAALALWLFYAGVLRMQKSGRGVATLSVLGFFLILMAFLGSGRGLHNGG